jgi:putative transposase
VNASASVLQVGDWVHVDGEDHQVVALSGTSVRLLSASGAASVVLASFLLGALDFALVKATTTPRRVEPFGLLEGLPGEAVAQAREWERHLVEVVTGLPPGAPQDAKPRPQYDVAVPLNERDRAKAEELTAAGQPVSERTVRRLRARYAEQGLVGLVD